jgi:hypothetical protein
MLSCPSFGLINHFEGNICKLQAVFANFTGRNIRYIVKEIPHNARSPLAGEFQPLAACKVAKSESLIRPEPSPAKPGTALPSAKLPQISITRQVTFDFCSSQSTKIPSATEPLDYAVFP